MNITTLTAAQLRRAADVKENIDALQEQLAELLGNRVPVPFEATIEAPVTPKNGRRKRRKRRAKTQGAPELATTSRPRKRKRRQLSPEGLANIRAGVAKRVGKKAMDARVSEDKPKSKYSPAARKRFSELMKARWAARRAAGKTRL